MKETISLFYKQKKNNCFYIYFFLNSQIFHWVQIKTGRNWTQSLRELFSKVLWRESISIYGLSFKTNCHQIVLAWIDLAPTPEKRAMPKTITCTIWRIKDETHHVSFWFTCLLLTLTHFKSFQNNNNTQFEESKIKFTAWFWFPCLLLTLTNFKPGQNNYKGIQTCPIRKSVNP